MSQLLANTQTIAAIARERLSCPNENFSCLPDLKIGNREQVVHAFWCTQFMIAT